MSKVFIVTEIGWEYDDEYYYQGESDGGRPIKGFKTKEKAEQRMHSLNAIEFKRLNEDEYCSLSEYINYGEGFENEFIDYAKQLDPDCEVEEDYFSIRKDLTDEETGKLLALTGISFYEVYEIEVE